MSKDDAKALSIGLGDPDHDPEYARLRAALGETSASLAPPSGWEAKVWERIEAEPTRSRARWGWFASGALAMAAAVALLVWQPWRGDDPARSGAGAGAALVALAPDITIRSGAQLMRSDEAAPGDSLLVQFGVAGAAVWVYFDEQLMHQGGARVELVLERPGTYHVISTVGPRTAPASLDAALAALVTGGVRHHRREIVVR
jgi:hypothetical protein